MRLEQLHYLLELYKTRSFSKAAENVFITQPSLSTAISTLEDELGIRLFERMRSGVYPTNVGEEVIKIAAELIECEKRIYESVSKTQLPDRIRLMTIPAVSHSILLDVISSFQKTQPNVNITLNEYAPQTIISDAISPLNKEPGTFAIAAFMPSTYDETVAQLKKDSISVTRLFTDRFVCFVSKNHPLAKNVSVTEEEFLKYPGIDLNLLSKNPQQNVYTHLQQKGTNTHYARLKENTNIEVDTTTNLKRLVLNGGGVALMPFMIIYQDKDYLSGDLIALPFSDLEIKIDYCILKSTLYPLKPMESKFLDMLVSYFSDITKQLIKENV